MTQLAPADRSGGFIAGEWFANGDETFHRTNPADTSEQTGPYLLTSAADVERAVTTAEAAASAWGRTTPRERSEVLLAAAELIRKRRDVVAADLTREVGKTLAEARAEVAAGADTLTFYAGAGTWLPGGRVAESLRDRGRVLFTRSYPHGVVAIITPWNFPFSNPCIKLAAALTTGNCVVWKPAPWSPATALHLTAILDEAGAPTGVVNTVLGGAAAGEQLVGDERVGAVTFTGSTQTGRRIAGLVAARGAAAQMEMGGKNAVVVLPDADLETAARDVAAGAFLFAGQKCSAVSRVLVHNAVRARFQDLLIEATENLVLGDPRTDDTDVGPVVHERQLDRHLAAIDTARRSPGELLAGGKRANGPLRKGLYLAPTVLADLPADAPMHCEEVFGPVLAISSVADSANAITEVNRTPYGLAGAVYTHNQAEAWRFIDGCQTGTVKVNEPPVGLEPHVPTGGWKQSGLGQPELGPASLEFFTRSKTVYFNHGAL